jgi:hypothetical protein
MRRAVHQNDRTISIGLDDRANPDGSGVAGTAVARSIIPAGSHLNTSKGGRSRRQERFRQL